MKSWKPVKEGGYFHEVVPFLRNLWWYNRVKSAKDPKPEYSGADGSYRVRQKFKATLDSETLFQKKKRERFQKIREREKGKLRSCQNILRWKSWNYFPRQQSFKSLGAPEILWPQSSMESAWKTDQEQRLGTGEVETGKESQFEGCEVSQLGKAKSWGRNITRVGWGKEKGEIRQSKGHTWPATCLYSQTERLLHIQDK